MKRAYDGSRRKAAAGRTRDSILEAAFRLHGEGRTDLESLAAEADVSLATVRKHFPTREVLFEGCTAFGMHAASPPDLAGIAAIADPNERLEAIVREGLALYERLLGQIWIGYRYRDSSPAMAAAVGEMEALGAALGDIAVGAIPGAEGEPLARGQVHASLSYLGYRALRVPGGLSPEQAATAALGTLRAIAAGVAVGNR